MAAVTAGKGERKKKEEKQKKEIEKKKSQAALSLQLRGRQAGEALLIIFSLYLHIAKIFSTIIFTSTC